MVAIAPVPPAHDTAARLAAVAAAAGDWLAREGVALRDAVVLVPFAAMMPPVRAAFAARGGWLPRVETALTLAASLAPSPAASPGAPSGDAVLDRLAAAVLLRQVPALAARERADRRGFDVLVASFVQTAQALRLAALAQSPAERAAYFARAVAACPPAGGPGALEATMLRLAVEWAESGATGPADRLFEHRPGAWIVLRVGGHEALAESVAAAAASAGVPSLVCDLDAAGPGPAAPRRLCADGFEDEAAAAAAEVIAALDASRAPVALVALDRSLVRRVHALLERHGIGCVDETGWTLSTTRAAAALMARLRAAAPGAGPDTRLDWLKTWPPARARPRALDALESAWRRGTEVPAFAQALAEEAAEHQAPFAARRERSLADWLALLAERLAADGSGDALAVDPAGQQLLAALRLDAGGAAWREATAATRLDLAGFTGWVDQVLEGAQFEPPLPEATEVVLTPLSRAVGRPFGAVIVPGADDRRLGAVEPAPGLVSEALAEALGLDGAARRRERQRLAFARLLDAPSLVLLRRRRDGDEPLAPSPEVEAMALRRAHDGAPWAAERDWQPAWHTLPARPVPRPLPTAPQDLPATLSATVIETLRTCPYRFFARGVLRLYEADELEAGLEKRDYGTWLHAVLHHFHRDRVAGGDDRAALAAAADAVTAAQGLDAAELLPYRASFEGFVPAYLAWLAAREAAGWRWDSGETEREAAPPALAPARLKGRLDRLDRASDGSLQVIDYKTGRTDDLKQKVRQPLEDTQLAVYATLEPAATTAAYLTLDDEQAPNLVEHAGVRATAEAFVLHLGAELQRLREGAPMPALGEGRPCETCEARGLCRRDHWSAP